MNKIFDQGIETENNGMAGGASYYDIEDLYQAFKDRLIKELRVNTDELMNYAEIIDISED